MEGDAGHLLFNSLTLFFFGPLAENFYARAAGPLAYPLFYLAGIVYDLLYPIGHTLAGHMLRWGLGAESFSWLIVFVLLPLVPVGRASSSGAAITPAAITGSTTKYQRRSSIRRSVRRSRRNSRRSVTRSLRRSLRRPLSGLSLPLEPSNRSPRRYWMMRW